MGRSSPRRSTRTVAKRFSSAPLPTMRNSLKPRCAGHSRIPTCWCFRAAPPRAPATYRIGSSRGSANPASSPMPWRSSRASRYASGFATSAVFPFHDMIVPVLRRMAGLPPRSDAKVVAKVPVRIASELGRTEFVMVSLVEGDGGLIAYPSGKGRGAITSFAQADGFLKIDALADQMPAGSEAEVTLFTPHVRVPDLVIVGSHCTGLDLVTAPLARAGLSVRSIAVGSLGGLAAARRGECDFAPIHLFDEATESYNTPFLMAGLELVPGWRRMQGIVFRSGDARFEGLRAQEAVRTALADPACIMV